MSELKNRIDFLYIIDVQDGNPNGDPDAGNLPRVDAETGIGLITDVCIKRKVRNYVQLVGKDKEGLEVFVCENEPLNAKIARAYERVEKQTNAETGENGNKRSSNRKSDNDSEKAKLEMLRQYFDVRTFGAVMNTGKNAGQVRGPVQLTFARSVDPVCIAEHTLTRVTVTREEDWTKKQTDIGRKSTIPYGIYVCHGFISANLARQTGFSEEDLSLFWEALQNMFECDRSAARGLMSARKLYVFKHATELGNAPAHSLFDRVTIKRKDESRPARAFSDYEISINTDGLAEKNIDVQELIDGLR